MEASGSGADGGASFGVSTKRFRLFGSRWHARELEGMTWERQPRQANNINVSFYQPIQSSDERIKKTKWNETVLTFRID